MSQTQTSISRLSRLWTGPTIVSIGLPTRSVPAADFKYLYYSCYSTNINANQRRSSIIYDYFFQENIFQSLSSQSPAPVTILEPAPSPARYSTRLLWPIIESFFSRAPLGPHFHKFIWLRLYPCVVTNQLLTGEYIRLQIWEPVSISLTSLRVFIENTRSLRSAIPAPEVTVAQFGLKPMALTAAWWLSQLTNLVIFFKENKTSLLSLPPVAIMSALGLSLSPQIY